jgi:hypothetical protein
MAFYGLTIRDALGVLGNANGTRLLRTIYEGFPSNGQQIHLPDYSYNDGIIFVYLASTGDFVGPLGPGDYRWNESTRILTGDGIYSFLIVAYRGAFRKISGSYGLTITNSDNQVIIDGRNPNVRVMARGTATCTSQVVTTITFPSTMYPRLWIRMPDYVYFYVGRITSTSVNVSIENNGPIAFEWVVTGLPPGGSNTPASSYGLTMRSPTTGAVTFSSAYAHPRIYGGMHTSDFPIQNIYGDPLTSYQVTYPVSGLVNPFIDMGRTRWTYQGRNLGVSVMRIPNSIDVRTQQYRDQMWFAAFPMTPAKIAEINLMQSANTLAAVTIDQYLLADM